MAQGRKQLTNAQMFSLAEELVDENQILKLAIHLGIEKQVKLCLKNTQDDRHAAVYNLLKTWYQTQDSPEAAYTNLWNTLRHPGVQLNQMAARHLDGPPDSPPEGAVGGSSSQPQGGAGVVGNTPPGGAVGGTSGGDAQSAAAQVPLTSAESAMLAGKITHETMKIIATTYLGFSLDEVRISSENSDSSWQKNMDILDKWSKKGHNKAELKKILQESGMVEPHVVTEILK